MIKAGKKTKEWAKVRKELKKDFETMGITTCELRVEGCWNNNALSFAHTLKRRNVTDLKRVVLACVPCHQKVERMIEAQMEAYLENIIKKRNGYN